MNTSTQPYALEARDLSVVLGGREVLQVPSLQLLPNEVLVVVGPNGSGKTTLLLALALLLKPQSGTVSYLGHPVDDGWGALNLRRRFGVVFQDPLLLDGTVWDNVTLGLRLRGVARPEIEKRTRRWLERFGIAGLATRHARALSGGEARRVSLARAFALQPDILFLDEPFTALDSPTRQSLIEDFEDVLHETRVSTIMVTHDRNEALVLAGRVAVLMGGRIRQMGSPQEVFSAPVDEEVAGFVEAGNILYGTVTEQRGGLASVRVGEQHIDAVSDLPVGASVAAVLRHEDITVSLPPPGQPSSGRPASSARNRFSGAVSRIVPLGAQVRLTLDCSLRQAQDRPFPLVALITKRSLEDMGLAPGQTVVASFKASSVHLIPRR